MEEGNSICYFSMWLMASFRSLDDLPFTFSLDRPLTEEEFGKVKVWVEDLGQPIQAQYTEGSSEITVIASGHTLDPNPPPLLEQYPAPIVL